MRSGNGGCLSLYQKMDSIYHENSKWRVSIIRKEMESINFENGKWRVSIMRTGNVECLL
jgi:hypothetical protein